MWFHKTAYFCLSFWSYLRTSSGLAPPEAAVYRRPGNLEEDAQGPGPDRPGRSRPEFFHFRSCSDASRPRLSLLFLFLFFLSGVIVPFSKRISCLLPPSWKQKISNTIYFSFEDPTHISIAHDVPLSLRLRGIEFCSVWDLSSSVSDYARLSQTEQNQICLSDSVSD